MPNKLLLITSLFLYHAASFSADTELTITGKIWDNTCEIDIPSKNFTIDLGSNSSKSFLDLNQKGPKNYFDIKLSQCGNSTKEMFVTFNGVQDSDNTDLLSLDKTINSANGVSILIEYDGQKIVPINKKNAIKIELLPNQSNIIRFSATLVSTKLPVKVGQFTASADFLFEYL